MKRLTWALWSLMLFLGMGTAFADVEQPVITPASGSAVTIGDMVTITCETPGATIYYATDKDYGISDGDIEYTGAFALTEAMIRTSGSKKGSIVIKAIAYVGEDESMIATATYTNITIPGAEPEEVEQPEITPASGTAVTIGDMVTITCGTTGATIYYSTEKDYGIGKSDIEYTGSFALTEAMIRTSGSKAGSIVIKAIAYLGENESMVATATYTNITKPEPDPEEVAQPEFTPASGSTVHIGDKVTISCGTPGATIRYTATNTYVSEFTDPEYTEPFELTESMIKKSGQNEGKIVIYAMAYKGDEESLKATAIYEVATDPEPVVKPAAPTFDPDGGEVEAGTTVTLSLAAADADCDIYYNIDGEDADFALATSDDLGMAEMQEKVILYESGIELTADATVKAAAVRYDDEGNLTWSDIETKAFTVTGEAPETVATPVITPGNDPGTAKIGQMVTITCETNGATIYYTTDKSEPTAQSTVYTEPFAITEAMMVMQKDVATPNGIVTVRAVAIKDGVNSDLNRGAWEIIPNAPEIAPAAGEVENGTKVTLSCVPAAAKIYYTTDGTTPTEESTLYAEAIEISEDMTIQAYAVLGQRESSVVTAAYTVAEPGVEPVLPETVKAPAFNPAAGEVEKGTEVTWTWSEEYEYDVMGVVYVANGKDEDLAIDAAKFEELVAAWTDGEDMVREDGQVYLYYEGEGAYKIEKDATLKARLVLGVMKEVEEGQEGENPGMEIALSPIVEAAYTVKGETPVVETVAKPTFNPAAGAVVKGTKVEIACETEGAVIYYTVDGTEPTDKSVKYEAAVEINEAVTVKAIAVKGDAKSEVAEAAYTIDRTANEDEEELAGVKVYPNPSNGLFHIELPVAATVEVFMSNGVLYRRLTLGEGNATLNIERSGIYFLRITGEGRTVIKRVIVR